MNDDDNEREKFYLTHKNTTYVFTTGGGCDCCALNSMNNPLYDCFELDIGINCIECQRKAGIDFDKHKGVVYVCEIIENFKIKPKVKKVKKVLKMSEEEKELLKILL